MSIHLSQVCDVLGILMARIRERREQQQHHERMNKPASKKQLEEVWEKDDGLMDETFDPKTFFFLHGEMCMLCRIAIVVMFNVSSPTRY